MNVAKTIAGNLQRFRRLNAVVFVLCAEADARMIEYLKHQGRANISQDDIRKSLRYQTKHFSFEAFSDKIREMEHAIEDSQNSVDDWEDVVKRVYPDTFQGLPENSTQKVCNCQICREIGEIDKNWDVWEPEDTLLKYLKVKCDTITL